MMMDRRPFVAGLLAERGDLHGGHRARLVDL